MNLIVTSPKLSRLGNFLLLGNFKVFPLTKKRGDSFTVRSDEQFFQGRMSNIFRSDEQFFRSDEQYS